MVFAPEPEYAPKTRDHKDAKRFFKKALQSFHVSKPRVITGDKNPVSFLNSYYVCTRINRIDISEKI
ncbi:hypothetical protein COF38_16740 [Bacillus pseudomycoides]|nr:hypothetical protein COF38_16740 [Bacillus pseudomycoides]